jgi:hypothetical protein
VVVYSHAFALHLILFFFVFIFYDLVSLFKISEFFFLQILLVVQSLVLGLDVPFNLRNIFLSFGLRVFLGFLIKLGFQKKVF